MVTAAAFFDLDRTVLAGASGPVFARHLRGRGLGPRREPPGASSLVKLFDLTGETWLTMQLAKATVRASRGWPEREVLAAAEDAGVELAALAQPFLAAVLDEHRAAGRELVLASSSPDQLIRPLAEHLGFDSVVATRWEVRDGRYTGRIDGDFVWGRGKLDGIRRWAEVSGVSLAESWAYSDSYFDAPMLEAVGHPVAVNPDPGLALLASLRRWPVRHLDAPEGVLRFAGIEAQDLLRRIAHPLTLAPFARLDVEGLDRIPTEGGAILCANHRSYLDPLVVGLVALRTGRPVRFLAKKELFDAPVVGPALRNLGVIRVERGTGSEEPLLVAAHAVRAGELVAVFPQGTIPRGPAFCEPELQGRWGAAKLAAATGAPVVPIGLWGTEQVWPRNARAPQVRIDDAPRVAVRVGEPLDLGTLADGAADTDLDASTRRIMAAITALLPEEARAPRTPTEEELRATHPPGYQGDVAASHVRSGG
jgi:putative phosphoserine phosphatase/1-acylglycerol-3-phosphate O-acyltransferase